MTCKLRLSIGPVGSPSPKPLQDEWRMIRDRPVENECLLGMRPSIDLGTLPFDTPLSFLIPADHATVRNSFVPHDLSDVTGCPFFGPADLTLIEGFKIMRPLRTVIVAGEGARGLKRRIAAWAKRHGIKTDDLPILVIPVMPRFADEGDLDKLIRTIKAKLPDPDYVIVDTAMWAASGLNLNIPADSQILLSSFKRVMLYLGCSLTFVHHTGKDKKREQLGAENLIAGVDVADRIDLEEKGTGYRRIKITNKKMKDAELRETISMEAHPETVGTEEDGRKVGSLVLRRCQESAKVEAEHDPRLTLALGIIAENKGKMPLNMSELAEKMTRRSNSEDLSDGELEKAKEGMRSYLRKAATRELAVYAHKAGKARNAQWVFEDR